MTPNTTRPAIKETEQAYLGSSFDADFEVLAVENLVYNPSTNSLERMMASSSPTATFLLADEDETATYSYTGFQDKDGRWYIVRESLASGAYRYASGNNNYTTNWTNRASLTYNYPEGTF